jgi:SAM-dependent methyltransferase
MPCSASSMTLPTTSVAWLLGLEGIALLRAIAGDVDDEAFVDQRLAEAARILTARGAPDPAGQPSAQPVDTRTGYDLWAPTYDSEHNPLLAAEQAVVWPWLNQLPPGLAVDAACGTGRYASLLAAHGHTVVGIDSSPGMLAIARHKVPTARLLLGDLTALPVADHAADLVICALALTHQPTLNPALKEFARILRPGGQLIVSDIHVASLYLGGIVHVRSPQGQLLELPAARFLASDYLKAAVSAGFNVLDCAEPRWGLVQGEGGGLAGRWCPAAAAAAYRDTPAAIAWRLERRG